MSFVGDLEHLPIVDLIQLLHYNEKIRHSRLEEQYGERASLVFNDGFIVSANHYNNSIRVGQILVDMNAITSVQLDQTLQEQKSAGKNRAPIIATLIEKGT